jgi:DNA-binding SARP family transcriptional activator
MAHLSVFLLGPYEVTLDGEPVTGFKYDKVLALLAYLIVEADRAHRRDVLAALLWPDYPNRTARTNLRNALSHLRAAVGDRRADEDPTTPPFLLITRETIQFNAASDYWLDVEALRTCVCVRADREGLPVTDLYRGPFLEGFTVQDSVAFEDWALLTRERLEQLASTAFERTIGRYKRQGALVRATECARRWVELAPWQERAHRRLMHLLALSGQRSAALRQYAECTRILQEELGAPPGEETTRLYRAIREQRGPSPPAVGVAEAEATLEETAVAPPERTIRHNLPAQATLEHGYKQDRRTGARGGRF